MMTTMPCPALPPPSLSLVQRQCLPSPSHGGGQSQPQHVNANTLPLVNTYYYYYYLIWSNDPSSPSPIHYENLPN